MKQVAMRKDGMTAYVHPCNVGEFLEDGWEVQYENWGDH